MAAGPDAPIHWRMPVQQTRGIASILRRGIHQGDRGETPGQPATVLEAHLLAGFLRALAPGIHPCLSPRSPPKEGGNPPHFPQVLISKDFKSNDFVSAHPMRLADVFFASAHSKGLASARVRERVAIDGAATNSHRPTAKWR